MPRTGDGRSTAGPLILLIVLLLCLVGVRFIGSDSSAPDREAGTEWNLPEVDPHPALAVSATSLDFGIVPVHGSVVRRIVVRNEGDVPLSASLSVSAPGTYELNSTRLDLAPGASAMVTVLASPAAPGILNDQLRIAIDGSKTDELLVALEGRVESSEGGRDATARSGGAGSGSATPGAGVDVAPAVPRPAPALPQGAGNAAAVAGRAPARPSVPGVANVSAGSRARAPIAAADSPLHEQRKRAAAEVRPFDPQTSVPLVALAESRSKQVPDVLTPEEQTRARELPEQTPGTDDPEAIPEDLKNSNPNADPFEDPGDDSGPLDDDPEDAEEEPDPFTHPTLTISGASSMTLIGKVVRFYPQEIGVLGGDAGGPLQLVGAMAFPIVPLAFGESMAFTQAGAVAGVFNSTMGQVDLTLPLAAVDSDGDAAPLMVTLTTGTIAAPNDDGIVVSLTGSARNPSSGLLKLVGIQRIPVGFNNNAEDRIVTIEVLATLTFGSTIAGGA